MTVVLYRSSLSLTSGAGQLIRDQAEGLIAAGETVRVLGRSGLFKYWLRTRLPVRRASSQSLIRYARSSADLLVDHSMEIAEAHVVFVHNLTAEGVRHVPREDWHARAEGERRFFRSLRGSTRIVANSRMVERALIEHFGLAPERISVIYPGIDRGRFASVVDETARTAARRALGIPIGIPLVGFVTSGDFEKRGFDIFLAAAERIAAARADVRFLVVGAHRLPGEAHAHPLVASKRLLYRPKSTRPEVWFAALDLFLYPARFEEFGMVVSEAQAAGLPVLTSRRVGAAECLPPEYGPWLLDAPDAAEFAEKTLALLDDDAARSTLASAGVENVSRLDRAAYAEASVRVIRAAR